MRFEFIDKVKENDVLAKSILTNDGSALLKTGIKLTNEYIYKLKQLGVFYLYIEDKRLEDVESEDEYLSKMKREVIKNMSQIVKNINCSNSYNLKEPLIVVDDMVKYILETRDVCKSLYDIQTYDNYTYLHSVNTGIMSIFLGLKLSVKEDNLKQLAIGAILHDIGKTKIPISIITKKGKLTQEEYNVIKKHPIYGEEIVSPNKVSSDIIIKSIEQHHERIDGTGYPYGLKKNEISKYAKIVSICDVYDAVSNNRSYRRKFSPSDAYELILAGSGAAFDEKIVKKFKRTFAVYPLGVCIRLSNGVEGYVIRQNIDFPDRPIIRVLYDAATKNPIPFYEIDLLKNPYLAIISLV